MVSAGSSYDPVSHDHSMGEVWHLVSCDKDKDNQTWAMPVHGGMLYRHVFRIVPHSREQGQTMVFAPH